MVIYTLKLKDMKKIVSMLLCVSVLFLIAGCGSGKKLAKTDAGKFQYELEGVSNGTQGSYLVKVWSYSGTKKTNIENCKKNAVHGIIFKGYAGSDNVRPQYPLAREAGVESMHADFFEKFFADGGEYSKYVTVTIGSQEFVKVGRKYKVGLVVSVAKDQLRKALESAGVVKSLSSGF